MAGYFDEALGLLNESGQPKPVGTSDDLSADEKVVLPKSAPISQSLANSNIPPTPSAPQAVAQSNDEEGGDSDVTTPEEDAVASRNYQANNSASASVQQAPSAPTNYFDQALQQKLSDSVQADLGDHPGSVNNPIKSSPIPVDEAGALGFGNEKGNLEYLKNRFQDVAVSPEYGILVKKDNAWYEANLGYTDPWKLTRDLASTFIEHPSFSSALSAGVGIAKDLGGQAVQAGKEFAQHPLDKSAELVSRYGPNVLLSSEGASAAMTAAAPLATAATVVGGPLAGAAVEGAAGLGGAFLGGSAGGAARTSLGRLVGTYSATPEEQVGDIGMEGLMGLGGQAIELGSKPALSQLAKSMDFIKRNAVEPAKDAIADVMGAATSAGGSAMRTAMEAGGKVAAKMRTIGDEAAALKSQLSGLGEGAPASIVSQDDIVNAAAKGKADAMKSILARATRSLPEKHEAIMSDLYEKAEQGGMKAAPGDVLQAVSDHLETNGIGKIVSDDATGDLSFRQLTPSERSLRRNLGQSVSSANLPDSSEQAINDLVQELSTYKGIKSSRGAAAAKTMNDMGKSINQITDQFFSAKQPEIASVTNTARVARDAIGKQFESADLGAEYGARRELYNQYGDAVHTAKQVLNNDGAESLANKLADGKPGKNLTAKGVVGNLVELGGDASQKDYENMMVYHAVQKLTPWRPSFGLVQLGATGGAVATAGPSALMSHPFVAPLIATQFSPIIVGKEMIASSMLGDAVASVGRGTKAALNPAVQYAFATKDFIRSLSEPALKSLLNNPDALKAVLGTAAIAPHEEDQLKEQLLKQYGVIP